MSDKQQSAVYMLFEEIIMFKENGGYYLVPFVREETFNQAKELFKQQIIDAVNYGANEEPELGLEYFSETFKTESNGK